jgi:hypothetical protein
MSDGRGMTILVFALGLLGLVCAIIAGRSAGLRRKRD